MKLHHPLALLTLNLSLFGAESNSSSFNNLLNEIDTLTQTAKTQRANIDYLPYIMTVFEGEELAKAGAHSLKEALTLAAGVNLSRDNLSLFNPTFRGSNPTAYGQSKLIIDGIEVNDLFFDGYTAYLAMPIDMIKRIEIVRGPGSYSDGHWGYAGSIVITTYKKESSSDGNQRWFTSLGSDATRKAGASYSTSKDDLTFAADLYTVHDNLSLYYGEYGLSNNLLGAGNAHLSRSGSAPSSTDATMFSASLVKGAFFIDGRISSYRHGSEGGINYALASGDDHYNIDQWQLRSGAMYHIGDFNGKIEGAVIQDSFTSHQLLAPLGLRLPSLTPPTVIVTYPDGFYGNHEAIIRTYEVKNTLTGNLAGGETTLGLNASWSSVKSEKTITTDRDRGTGMTDYSLTFPFFKPDGAIHDFTAYATYEKVITPSLSGYASLTIDHRNSLNTLMDPRIAAVYAIDPENLLKWSLSKAHRNPSWQEMFTLNNRARWGNPDLLPETVLAYEAQYIHHFAPSHTFSVNLFRLENDDQIHLRYNTSLARYEYVNGSKSRIEGIETEWKKQYDTTSFYSAYTYTRGKDGSGVTLPYSPAHSLKGFITHALDANLYASLSGRWQSSTPRTSGDTRAELGAISIVDISVAHKVPYINGEVQLTLKNIADKREYYPSPVGTYDTDYPSTGRSLMVTLRGMF
jgi:outer membrane cobalamin receptor